MVREIINYTVETETTLSSASGQGIDQMYGGNKSNILIAGQGSTLLVAGKGNDKLYGGGGNNVFIGGPGADYFACGSGGAQQVEVKAWW